MIDLFRALASTFAVALAASGCSDSSSRTTATPRVPAEAIERSLDAAATWIASGQVANAEAILVALTERAPDEARVHALLGEVLARRAGDARARGEDDAAAGLFDRSLSHYERACELLPDAAPLAHAAGVIAIAAGRPDAALDLFDRAAAIDPVSPQHPLYAAQVLLADRRLDEAETRLRRVLVIDAANGHARAALASVAVERGEPEVARAEMAEAVRLAPRDAAVRTLEARILRQLGEPEAAAERLFALAAAEGPTTAIAGEIEACAEELDRPDLAVRAWSECFRASPRGPDAHRAAARAGIAAADAGRPDDARRWLEQARALRGDDVTVRELARRLEETGG